MAWSPTGAALPLCAALVIISTLQPRSLPAWPCPVVDAWFTATWNNRRLRTALLTSLKAALATPWLILGSLAGIRRPRFRSLRETVSFVLILRCAPGI